MPASSCKTKIAVLKNNAFFVTLSDIVAPESHYSLNYIRRLYHAKGLLMLPYILLAMLVGKIRKNGTL